MGLAAARALAQAGRDVVVCEQFELGHERGSSHGSSRIVRLSYPDARWVRLAQESFPLWRELEAESGASLLDLQGTLDLGDSELHRDALDACGVTYEVLDADEIERRFPIRAGSERGLFQADGGIIRADRAVAALAAGAAAAGAQLRERHRVDAVEEDGDGVTAGGIRARAAVVTAGAWAPALVGVDATPTIETVSYFDFDEPVPSVIDTTTGAHSGYALQSPGGSLKAGIHQTGRPDGPGRGRPRQTASSPHEPQPGSSAASAAGRRRGSRRASTRFARTTSSCSSAAAGSSSARRAAATASSSRR